MKWISPAPISDSSALPVNCIDFDMIRAIIGARQAACATVRAMGAGGGEAVADDARQDSTMALLAGRRPVAADAGVNGGAFAAVETTDGPCAARDQSHG